jgi:hypothetical protein
MNKNRSHIVSTFSWDTVFDDREQAFALQERLSDWCGLHLQKEVEKVFNRLCPADQTWKIDRLEIDLGVIDIENLESDLLAKIGRYLEMRLREMILYTNNSTKGIEITSAAVSAHEMIAYFLLHGILPWNRDPQMSSLNDLLKEQLSHHPVDMIDLFSEIGKINSQVRKRMAWQFSDPNLVLIIKGLEPSNSEEILLFRDEMENIQQTQRLVPTGNGDFRKQLWEWILNYLYAERGSVFNERSFMKSNIRQMAGHYNIGYLELLEMIRTAVEKTERNRLIRGTFLTVFSEIINEEDLVEAPSLTENAKDQWQLLSEWFEGKYDGNYHVNPDELICQLSRADINRFSKLIRQYNFSLQLWTNITAQLTEHALEAIALGQNRERGGFIIESIALLKSLCSHQLIRFNQPLLWAAAIRNLRQNNDAATGNRLFMMDSILCLGKTNLVSWEKMLVQLVGAPVPEGNKTSGALEVIAALNDVFAIEISNRPPSFFNNHFTEQLILFGNNQDHTILESSRSAELVDSMRKYIRLYPAGAFEVLLRYASRPNASRLLSCLTDHHSAGLLLQQRLNGAYYRLLIALLKKLEQSPLNTSFVIHIEGLLMQTGLETVLNHPVLSLEEFADKVLVRLSEQVPVSSRYDFTRSLLVILGGEQNRELAVFLPVIQKIAQRSAGIHTGWLPGNICALIQQNNVTKEGVRVWLQHQLQAGRTEIITMNQIVIIAEYLLDGSGKIMQSEIGSYLSKLLAILPFAGKEKLAKTLQDIFWKCLLGPGHQFFNQASFQQLFREAVVSHFPDILSRKAGTKIQAEDGKLFSISHRQALRIVKNCIENCRESFRFQNHTISIGVLVKYLTDKDSSSIYQILSEAPFTDKQVDFISTIFGFSYLRACLLQSHSTEMDQALTDMECIYTVTASKGDHAAAATMEKELIRAALLLQNGGIWGRANTTGLLKSISNPVEDFISLVNEEGLIPGPVLREVLVDRQPELEDILPVKNELHPDPLRIVFNNGLLNPLIQSLISNGQIPYWYKDESSLRNTCDLLNAIVTQYPVSFVTVLRKNRLTESNSRFLEMSVSVTRLFRSIARMHGERRTLMSSLETLYKILGGIHFKGISGNVLQSLLFKRILLAWTSGNWAPVEANQVWNSLAWDFFQKTGISKEDFINELSNTQSIFPVSFIVSLNQFKTANNSSRFVREEPIVRAGRRGKGPAYFQESMTGTGIAVKNAGMVLLNSYIPLLFERLGLTSEGAFIDERKQHDAVHFLQFLVTGTASSEEHLLPLNKILCGLDISEPVQDSLEINEEEIEMMEGLLYGVISHWPDSGSQTPDGIRGNWLLRDGIMRKEERGWDLAIEHKPYDLLLERAPFSFSIIKFPWMPQPLTVKWKF